MRRPVVLALLAVSIFLVVMPLPLSKPGVPMTLKADEAAYYLMALSLAHDHDLRAEVRDFDRVFREFPYRPVQNLILMSDDAWQTAKFGKPYVYSFFAAPFAGLWGANGMLAFNLLLTVGMIWLGADYLSRWNEGWLAALFSAGFAILSAGWAYAFWLQPEVFNMAAVSLAVYLGFRDFESTGSRLLMLAGLSGAALMPAVYNKPMVLALALPLVVVFARRGLLVAGAWIAGAAVALAAIVGGAVALTGHPTPYLGVTRQGVEICEPGKMPIQPLPPPPAGGAPQAVVKTAERPTGGAWSWIFSQRSVDWPLLVENLGYFLWGRHTGFLVYFPFAAIAVGLFLWRGRQSERWLLLGSLAAVALFSLAFISHNWQGGGGFIGNRYFVNVVPAFLFLVTRLDVLPALAGFLTGALFLGQIVFAPFAPVGPEPTWQGHVRGAAFQLLPLELSLRELPGYLKVPIGGRTVMGRRDAFLPQGEELWTRGADTVELWWIGAQPIESMVFDVRSLAPGNRVELEMGDASENLEFGAVPAEGESRRVTLRPGSPTRIRRRGGATFYNYRLTVRASDGRNQIWTREAAPTDCPYFSENRTWREDFPVGAAVTWMGEAGTLDRDVFAARWDSCSVPPSVAPAATFAVPVAITNTSAAVWPTEGGARVRLAFHWKKLSGETVLWDGERSELGEPLAPGASRSLVQRVQAPAAPGRYLLELEPVFERVGWFSAKDPSAVCRAEVEVGAATAPAP